MALIDEVSGMAKSQAARANVLDKLRYELLHLSYVDQVKVTKELITDLAICLQQNRKRATISLRDQDKPKPPKQLVKALPGPSHS